MATPPALEQFLGLQRYLSDAPGIGGRLRERPEDFAVEEIPHPPAPAQGPGKYTIATLRATNWETNRLVEELARALHVSRNRVFFAGTKDKRAVKTQQMALPAPEAAVRALALPGLEVLATYRADRAPKLGELVGNRFIIVARQLDADDATALGRCRTIEEELRTRGGAPNFYGLQRFGSLRPVTQKVGERMVRGDFEGAVLAYVADPQPGESAEVQAARRRVQETRDFGALLTSYPQHLRFERVLITHLAKRPDDWVGALRQLPLNLRMMFVYAYQSLLFNRIISARIAKEGTLATLHPGEFLLAMDEEGVPDADKLIPVTAGNLAKCEGQVAKGRAAATAPLFGREVPLADGPMGELEQQVLDAEGVPRDAFQVPAMPEVASDGQRRAITVRPAEWECASQGPGQMTFRFRLPKGCYATSVLREFLKSTDALDY